MDASTLSVSIAATQFVNPEAGSPGVQMATQGGIFLVLAFVTDTAWALAAGALTVQKRVTAGVNFGLRVLTASSE